MIRGSGKARISAFLFYSNPSGNIQGSSDATAVDLNTDLGFNSYSTSLFNASASISAAAQVIGEGVHQAATVAKASLLAPIPVAGPDFRFYLTNSPRLFVEGQVNGMYFFGHGNFVSTADDIGLTITKHLSVNAGYQLGSRLVVKNDANSNRIGLRLTQSGAIVGLQASF